FDVGGTLLDFTVGCPAHKSLRLSALGVSTPSCAVLWTAKNVYELTQGVQVAESLQLSPASRALFFTNNSPLASADTFEPPTEDNLVRVMLKLVVGCKDRQSAFASAECKKLVCSDSHRQSSLILAVAERVRAELDRKKALRSDSNIVLGGNNARMLSEVLGATYVETPTVPDLRIFFEGSHFQAAVQRIYVWMDINNEQFEFAHQSQLVPALRDIVVAAAKWGHVKFVDLPVPYAAGLLPIFESFMQQFNEIVVGLPNVPWLNDNERLDGARLAHSLGSNALIPDFTTVSKLGHVSRRAARAALRFIRQLKPSFVSEHVDLSDKRLQQQTQDASQLHDVRRGEIEKNPHGSHSHRGGNSSRGAPFKQGGGGSRGNIFNKHKGNRRN
ncbi:hypothetical protein AAVH_35718, partial [Aphelenchoides avenae]